MKRRNSIRLCAAAVTFIAIFVLAGVGAAQDETQTPREAVEEKQPAGPSFTIYPVPNYGGDLRSRSYLTGDWGGLRSKLADRGVQFEFSVTQIFQDVASGGTNRTGRYSGLTDMVLKLDFQKLGLWP